MITRGEYDGKNGELGVICSHTKDCIELILVRRGNVWSAFKKEGNAEYSFNNNVAKSVYNSILKKGLNGCKANNCVAAPFVLGTVSRHSFTKAKTSYIIDKYNGELAGAEIRSDSEIINLVYCQDANIMPKNIPYITLTVANEFKPSEDGEEPDIKVRTLQEIALEKDISYVFNSNYYIVNDEDTSEKIFDAIEKWNGVVSYDTETTGLRINMFSKINSKWKKMLDDYNAEKPKAEQIRADRLVGVILCVEEKTSYYFPCFNRKFKNLYQEVGNPIRERLIQNFKAYYTVGPGWQLQTDMARYWRDTPSEAVSCDCILMERLRKILTTKNILAHHGSFEWKVSYCYDIDVNLKEDTMLMHQLMYKFRSTTANSGEPSNLKYLSKREFNIDQLDLEDFFVDYKEDDSNEVRGSKKRGKKKKVDIDFSYMDYDGARAYAPGDGDLTLRLCHKYKRDMLENHREMLYIYSVEVIVACAIGYMEFFGHRIDERKINHVRDKYRYEKLGIEHKIRLLANLADSEEERLLGELNTITSSMRDGLADTEYDTLKDKADSIAKQCREHMDSVENTVSLTSPAQVAKLFFERLGYPYSGEKMSVAKKELKPLLKMKNEDGSNKYPAVHLYTEWKKLDTLLTKFFDNLQNFMYPGGFIFTSYGQISTATGRMNASKPKRALGPCMVTCG